MSRMMEALERRERARRWPWAGVPARAAHVTLKKSGVTARAEYSVLGTAPPVAVGPDFFSSPRVDPPCVRPADLALPLAAATSATTSEANAEVVVAVPELSRPLAVPEVPEPPTSVEGIGPAAAAARWIMTCDLPAHAGSLPPPSALPPALDPAPPVDIRPPQEVVAHATVRHEPWAINTLAVCGTLLILSSILYLASDLMIWFY